MNVSSSQGAFYYFVPLMLCFIMTINEILREKEKKLRLGITVMGMTHTSYWVSWLCTSFLVDFIITFNLIFTGYILNFDFFVKAP